MEVGVGGPGEGAPWRSAALDRMSMAQHQATMPLWDRLSQAVDVLLEVGVRGCRWPGLETGRV